MNSRCQSLLPWGLYVILPPIIVFILLEVACIVLWWKQEQNLIYNSQTNAVSFGKTSANDIQLLMNQHLAAISATANFISLTPFFYLTQEYWEYFVSSLPSRITHILVIDEPLTIDMMRRLSP